MTSVLYDQMDKTIIGIALSPVSLTVYDIANKIHLGPRLALTLGSSALTPKRRRCTRPATSTDCERSCCAARE